MKRTGKHGFTFVEIMTALALLAVLVVIAWGKFNKSFEKALRATMVSDLRNLATAQEIYYRQHLTYAADVNQVVISPSAKSQITITMADPTSWAAYTEIERTPEKCELLIGGNASSALGIATVSERIECGVP
jgi:prepilin-type N-terminal cleavage/methylation domain-containing protein